jgi:hypothetical protein
MNYSGKGERIKEQGFRMQETGERNKNKGMGDEQLR